MTCNLRVNERSISWIASITRALVDRGVMTTDELGRRMADISKRTQEST